MKQEQFERQLDRLYQASKQLWEVRDCLAKIAEDQSCSPEVRRAANEGKNRLEGTKATLKEVESALRSFINQIPN
jgi:uncharacterized protein (UPF0147 family)